jgi:hypothetical protein
VKTVMPHHHEVNLAPLKMNSHEWIVLAIGFVVHFRSSGGRLVHALGAGTDLCRLLSTESCSGSEY